MKNIHLGSLKHKGPYSHRAFCDKCGCLIISLIKYAFDLYEMDKTQNQIVTFIA